MAEAPTTPKLSLREREKLLDRAASVLDIETDVGFRQALRVIVRALSYVRYVKARIAAKFTLTLLAYIIPLMLIPWPMKVIVDHVILGQPIPEGGPGFPAYFVPFVQFLNGKSPVEMMLWIGLFLIGLVILLGAFGQNRGEASFVDSKTAGGWDTATQSENQANEGDTKAGGILGLLEIRVHMRLTQALNHLLRSQLFQRIESLPMTVLDDQRIGDTVYRVMYDTAAITNLLSRVIIGLFIILVGLAVGFYIMATEYGGTPEIIVVSFLMMPFAMVLTVPFARITRRRGQASRAAGSKTTGSIEEGMSNVMAVQSLGGTKRETQRFNKDSAESFKRFRAFYFVEILIGQMAKLGMVFAMVILAFLVGARVIDGLLTAGDFFVIYYYFIVLGPSMYSLGELWIVAQRSVPGMRRVFFLMDLPIEKTGQGVEMPVISSGVLMEHAGLTYPDGRRALKDINLEAKIGEIVALVGPSGAGKTSLAYLVPAFHQATAGVVSIDGINLKEASVESLREQVSYVFQETHLFSDSILENIRYGNRDATREQIEHVARLAGAHDFIMALPEGYDTNLGTVVSKLSVGQKQRIAIARGLLKDARILILDEPTSALDPETEAYLVDTLHKAARDKLVIIVAHRLSTIAHADKIYFLEDGEIREEGSHEELMAKPHGHYRQYVALQAGAH